jgi:tetratricopeptide (TPR) repeat protein
MLNKSYRLSVEAKFYFKSGDYKTAYDKAKEAYILDPYNRMAFTVYVQSRIAKEWSDFLKDSDRYFKEIKNIADKQNQTDKERQKVKIMLEILIDEYKNLKPSLLIDKDLKSKAEQQYKKAKEIYEKVFAK